MGPLQARVEEGRLVLVQVTTLPVSGHVRPAATMPDELRQRR